MPLVFLIATTVWVRLPVAVLGILVSVIVVYRVFDGIDPLLDVVHVEAGRGRLLELVGQHRVVRHLLMLLLWGHLLPDNNGHVHCRLISTLVHAAPIVLSLVTPVARSLVAVFTTAKITGILGRVPPHFCLI